LSVTITLSLLNVVPVRVIEQLAGAALIVTVELTLAV
jgi:hypothetical protein